MVDLETTGPEQLPLLARLHQLYRHDLSRYSGQDIGSDGCFDDAHLGQYVTDSGYRAYLFQHEGRTVGFGLVNLQSHEIDGEVVRNLDDFFILRACRRRGLGAAAARALFADWPGRWQVNKRTYNPVAMAFWDYVVRQVAIGRVREHVAQETIHMHMFRVAGSAPMR